ncbi:S-antigen protein-like [Physella acuta]|uniref:S-antigen protein-like n=1 Tax=Physella acuta TaxID=109671 RepID=UPI0027DCFAD9|nr:S-antigen protein-like [Physella acuta]
MKEIDLDKATIDTYHAWVQRGIRNDLNSISLGPGKLPFRAGIFMYVSAFFSLIIGILLVALRMRYVYLWDWSAQFLGPFFFILFLLCMAAGSYLMVLAKRRSNKYRSQLYFRPLGDWGVSCIHKNELALVVEQKHDLKSGTTPHKTVKPRSEAYSQSSKDARRTRPRDGRDNHAYDKSPLDANKPFRPEDRRRPDGSRGPPPEGRRGPPPDGRRGPPPDGRRGPPPDGRRGPPPDGRRGPPPEGRRGPPPEGRGGPPEGYRRRPDDRRPPENGERPRGPPPGYEERQNNDRLRPPPNGQRGPGGAARIPLDDGQGRRPRGVPRFDGVERIPNEDLRDVQLILDKSRDESSEI